MPNKLASLVVVSALLCTVGGASAFAQTLSGPEAGSKGEDTPAASVTAAKTEGKPSEELRADILKTVADTRAGKGKLATPSQFKPAQRNNLSKGQKVAIGVGIAAAIVVAVVVLHTRRHFLDGLNPLGTR